MIAKLIAYLYYLLCKPTPEPAWVEDFWAMESFAQHHEAMRADAHSRGLR